MRYNLLKMVQLILSGMDSDEVNSIGDTPEAEQVVDIIEQTYYELLSNIDFPDKWDLFELMPSNDPTRPTLMSLPNNVAKLEWIRYDASDQSGSKREWIKLRPLNRLDFLTRMDSLDAADANVYQYDLLVGTGTFDIRGYNDRPPTYYTTTNDRRILFDNYDRLNNTTLTGNQTQAYGMIVPVFLREDGFVPELEPRNFSLLFNEAKSQAFLELKQVENIKAERRARRGWNKVYAKTQMGDVGEIVKPWTSNFGRSGRRGGYG